MIDKRSLLVGMGALVALPFVGNASTLSTPVQREVKGGVGPGGALSLAVLDAAIESVPDAGYLIMPTLLRHALLTNLVGGPTTYLQSKYGYLQFYKHRLGIIGSRIHSNDLLPNSSFSIYIVSTEKGDEALEEMFQMNQRVRAKHGVRTLTTDELCFVGVNMTKLVDELRDEETAIRQKLIATAKMRVSGIANVPVCA